MKKQSDEMWRSELPYVQASSLLTEAGELLERVEPYKPTAECARLLLVGMFDDIIDGRDFDDPVATTDLFGPFNRGVKNIETAAKSPWESATGIAGTTLAEACLDMAYVAMYPPKDL